MRHELWKRRILAAAAACVLVLGLGTTATLAQGFGPGPGRGHGGKEGPPNAERMMERMTEKLDLSAQQQDQLGALLEANRENMQAGRDDMRSARETLKDAVAAENLDESAIRQASAVVASLQTEHALNRAAFLQQIREILSPEQMAEFQELKERRHERRAERRGRGFGPGGDRPRGF